MNEDYEVSSDDSKRDDIITGSKLICVPNRIFLILIFLNKCLNNRKKSLDYVGNLTIFYHYSTRRFLILLVYSSFFY